MAKKQTRKKSAVARKKAYSSKKASRSKKARLCGMPEMPVRQFAPDIDPMRESAIVMLEDKWANGTVLRYYFFDQDSDGEYIQFEDGSREWRTWTAAADQKDVVRDAFKVWADVGIGISFEEVDTREDAEVRIGFMDDDGSWSYLGRYILNIGTNRRTMNIGWDVTGDIDTAVHEIGHTLGLPHEHQNPNAGIVWDEEAVYADLAAPPNEWSRDKTWHNIIRKISPDEVQGSNWDHKSIMHYPFSAGLIKEPSEFRNGLFPPPGLSDRDKVWIRSFYPPLDPRRDPELEPFESVELMLSEGEQADFVIRPTATRYYDIRTFGVSDTVMVLFEDENGELKYRTGDDDSGEDYNASLRVKLVKDHRYVLRIRLYWSDETGRTAVMVW
jgi:hypothetical protein